MRRSKALFAALVFLITFMLISQVDAVTFSVTVTPEKLWPGDPVNITVNLEPPGLGVIIIWKPLLYNLGDLGLKEPIGNWCRFLKVFASHPKAMILTADILIFHGDGIEAVYPTTWDETTHFDPYYFDLCSPWNETYPIDTTPEIVLWNEDWEGCQEYFYGEHSGPTTNIVGKYFVVVFAVDAEWVESLLENICAGNYDIVCELICDPPWVGIFITSLLVIPEFFLGTVTAVATPILAFTTLSMLQRKRRHTG